MNNTELKHYGVLGMKWGRRKAKSDLSTRDQIKSAKRKYRQTENEAFQKYEKTIANIEKPYKRGQNLSAKDQAREAKAERDYVNAAKAAKNLYKQTVRDIKSSKPVSKGSKVVKGVLATAGVATVAGLATYITIGEAVASLLDPGSRGR